MKLDGAALGAHPSQIRDIMAHVRSLPPSVRDGVIRLDVGEPDLPVCHAVREAAGAAARKGTGYTDAAGLPQLRSAIAYRWPFPRQFRGRFIADSVRPEQIVVTAGATGALSTSFRFLEAGNDILVPDPGFPDFAKMAILQGLYPVPYDCGPGADWRATIPAIRRAITPKTSAIVVNAPANPAGTMPEEGFADQIAELARARDLAIISDETYDGLVFDREPLGMWFHAPERTFGIHSFSKNFSMTGYRMGFALAPLDLESAFAAMCGHAVSCPPEACQRAALAALERDLAGMARRRDVYRARRDAALAALAEYGLAGRPTDGGFYVLLELPDGTDDTTVAHSLIDQVDVATVPGSAFATPGTRPTQRFLRLALTRDEDQIREAVHRIAMYLSGFAESGGTVAVVQDGGIAAVVQDGGIAGTGTGIPAAEVAGIAELGAEPPDDALPAAG